MGKHLNDARWSAFQSVFFSGMEWLDMEIRTTNDDELRERSVLAGEALNIIAGRYKKVVE